MPSHLSGRCSEALDGLEEGRRINGLREDRIRDNVLELLSACTGDHDLRYPSQLIVFVCVTQDVRAADPRQHQIHDHQPGPRTAFKQIDSSLAGFGLEHREARTRQQRGQKAPRARVVFDDKNRHTRTPLTP